ncbi:MAG TPA: peptidoglycan-binding protein [Myxococcota bacterium]|jgi:N-acetylmuramoyl-L-alanine amidase|nr:peptidoglycan-binding protein [Myxococcota bacterium]
MYHVVREGDCIASLAEVYGLPADVIWDDPQNADLKSRRKDPNVLAKGDAVFIPERKTTARALDTDKRHRFRCKGPLVEFRLKLAKDGAPMADVPYRLEVDGRFYPPAGEARTDADGFVAQSIPPAAAEGTLVLPSLGRRFAIRLGHLEPVDVEGGLRARLRNLGFLSSGEGEALKAAVAAFQAAMGLDATGTPDDPTRDKLREAHGS